MAWQIPDAVDTVVCAPVDGWRYHPKHVTGIRCVIYRVYTKEWCGFKVNKKFISHLTGAQRTPSVAATVQVSHALPAVRFLCLLRGRGARFQVSITADMLHRVWDEFDYRVDVCRVTQGAHIEGLWLRHEKLGQFSLLTVYVVSV
jgi:hypothetical protein